MSQIFRLSVPLGIQAEDEPRKVEEQCAILPRPDVNKNIQILEQRVSGLKACMVGALGGIPHILSEIRDIKQLVVGDAGVQTGDASEGTLAAGCRVQTGEFL